MGLSSKARILRGRSYCVDRCLSKADDTGRAKRRCLLLGRQRRKALSNPTRTDLEIIVTTTTSEHPCDCHASKATSAYGDALQEISVILYPYVATVRDRDLPVRPAGIEVVRDSSVLFRGFTTFGTLRMLFLSVQSREDTGTPPPRTLRKRAARVARGNASARNGAFSCFTLFDSPPASICRDGAPGQGQIRANTSRSRRVGRSKGNRERAERRHYINVFGVGTRARPWPRFALTVCSLARLTPKAHSPCST